MPHAGFGVGALLLPQDHRRPAAKAADAADDRVVVRIKPVAGQRRELLDQTVDVVLQVRPLGMAGDQRLLPGRELRIGLPEQAVDLGLEARDLLGDVDVAGGGEVTQLLDLAFQLGNRLFEVEKGRHAPFTAIPAGSGGFFQLARKLRRGERNCPDFLPDDPAVRPI